MSSHAYKRKQLEQRHRFEKIKLVDEQNVVLSALIAKHQREKASLVLELDREKNLWRMRDKVGALFHQDHNHNDKQNNNNNNNNNNTNTNKNNNKTIKSKQNNNISLLLLEPLPPIPNHRQADRERVCSNPYPMPVPRSPKSPSDAERQNSMYTNERRHLEQNARKLIKKKVN